MAGNQKKIFSPDNLNTAPRSIDSRVLPSPLTRLLWSLPPSSKMARKSLRLIYGPPFKHMIRAGAAFQLKPTTHPQIWEIFWQGRKQGETLPYPPAIPDTDLWILATGPSIKNIDLSPLQDQTTFAVNGTIAVSQNYGISPDFYACFDYKFFRDRINLVKKTVESGAHCFFSARGISRICQVAPELLATGKISLLETVNRYYGIPALSLQEIINACSDDSDLLISPDNPKIGWSNDITKGVFDAKTIPYIACQISNHLKAKNVFILGMDLGSSSNQPIRAYESGPNACSSSLDEDFDHSILPSFKIINQQKNLTSNFWNLSVQSKLPESIIPKISLETALASLIAPIAP